MDIFPVMNNELVQRVREVLVSAQAYDMCMKIIDLRSEGKFRDD